MNKKEKIIQEMFRKTLEDPGNDILGEKILTRLQSLQDVFNDFVADKDKEKELRK